MIVHDLNIERIAIFKAKAHAPLVVDTNAPLTFTVMGQGL